MESLDSWKEEKRSAHVYRSLSEIESNPVHKKLFLDLSALAERQANIWERKVKEIAPNQVLTFTPDIRARLIIWLVQLFGARSLRVALAAMKIRGMSIYHVANSHPHPMPSAPIEMEHRHRSISKGNNIRAAVFGVNDGLISNASLILGIAGASANHSVILITGIAGLLAGACSMGAGEYSSVRSQREMLEYQLALEKSELELYPEEEAAELALIYEARGIPKEEAEKMANILIQNPEKALETLAREELGINPDDLVSPWGAALSSFFSFAIGAFIPLVPFLFGDVKANLSLMIILTGASLFIVGAALSLFTQKSFLWAGLRMLFIGAMAGTLTYWIGSFLNVNHL